MNRDFIRRSLLVVSPLDRPAVESAWTHDSDAVVVDLAALAPEARPEARPLVRDDAPVLGRGGAHVLVRAAADSLHADVDAAVWHGVAGVLVSYPEGVAAVREAQEAIAEAERRHGVEPGTMEIGVILGTPKGLLHIRDILTASPRVTMAALDERRLARAMDLHVQPDWDPFKYYVRGRFITETASLDRALYGPYGVHRIGIGFPLSCLAGAEASDGEVHGAAKWARDLGMNGALCPHPSWVATCNRAFTPTDGEIENHRRLHEAYVAGVAQGRGAVPLGGGRFVERPQDELAKAMIAFRHRCDERDAEKAAAVARARRSI